MNQTTNDYGFWDCFEAEHTKRAAHRRVGERGDHGSYLVTVYYCEDHDNLAVCETHDNGGEWEGEHHWATYRDGTTPEDALADYGLA